MGPSRANGNVRIDSPAVVVRETFAISLILRPVSKGFRCEGNRTKSKFERYADYFNHHPRAVKRIGEIDRNVLEMQEAGLAYCTITVNAVFRIKLPDVAVTVTV